MRKLSLAGAPLPHPVDEDQAEVENQMRHALGLPSSLPRREKDRPTAGPGPVVEHRSPRHAPHVNTNRLQIAEEALAAEQAAHQQAARALRHAQEMLLEAETKLGHSELARQEAVSARLAIEQAMVTERDARVALETELAGLRNRPLRGRPPRHHDLSLSDTEVPMDGRSHRSTTPPAASPSDDDAEPVQWWVPGWKASPR